MHVTPEFKLHVKYIYIHLYIYGRYTYIPCFPMCRTPKLSSSVSRQHAHSSLNAESESMRQRLMQVDELLHGESPVGRETLREPKDILPSGKLT